MATAIEQGPNGDVRVDTGTGIVSKLDTSDPTKRNRHLEIKATHTDLRYPVKAWVDTREAAVWPVLEQAYMEGREIEYRIECHRQRGVKPDGRSIDEVDNEEKIRDLVAVAFKSEGLGARDRIADPGDPAQAAAAADGHAMRNGQHPGHKPSAAPGAAQPGPTTENPPQADAAPEEADQPPQGDDHRTRPVPPSSRRPKVAEAKPWEIQNSDGSWNLGSYSYQATVGMVELAHRLVSDHNATLDADHQLAMNAVGALAGWLLDAADAVQAGLRDDGHSDRQDNSHTRARGAVRTALELYPVPWGATKEDRMAWLDELVGHATALLRTAQDLFLRHHMGADQ